jgi:hypothetical protein
MVLVQFLTSFPRNHRSVPTAVRSRRGRRWVTSSRSSVLPLPGPRRMPRSSSKMLYSEIKNHKSLFVDSGAITPFSSFSMRRRRCPSTIISSQFVFAPSRRLSSLGLRRDLTEFGCVGETSLPLRDGVVVAIGQRLEFPYRRWRRWPSKKSAPLTQPANSALEQEPDVARGEGASAKPPPHHPPHNSSPPDRRKQDEVPREDRRCK